MSILVQLPPDKYDADAFKEFNPNAGFDIKTARAMMWMSQLAYEAYLPGHPETIQAVATRKWDFESVVPFSNERVTLGETYDSTGIIGDRKDAVIIAFAGTDPGVWETVVSDVTLRLGGDTHAGFQDAADAVKEEVKKAIALSQAGAKPLFFTGHSLGAAVAAIAALDPDAKPAAVYGFGMPRPGNQQFHARYTAALGDRTFRFVHGLDIVARVPSGAGFRHVGRMLQCASGKKFSSSAASLSALESDEPLLSDELRAVAVSRIVSLGGLFPSSPGPGPFGTLFRVLPQPVRDHLQDSYWTALTS